MKLTKVSKHVQSFTMGGLMAAALMYAPPSYGQEASPNSSMSPALAAYANVGKGYAISSELVLSTPGGSAGNNTAVGYQTLTASPTGGANTAVGNSALTSDTTGSANTAVGWEALHWNTTGTNNTAFGWQALVNNDLTSFNTAVGLEALHNTDIDKAGLANKNTAIGWQAAFYNIDGANNTAVGYQACLDVVEGSNVTCIGANSGPSSDVTGPATFIANVYSEPTTGTGNPLVCVSSDGRLGTTGCASSAERSAQQEETNQRQLHQIQDQARRIAELEQRLSRLETLIGKNSN